MIRLYIIGLSILVIAIVANGVVLKLQIKTWYDFIALLSDNGGLAFQQLTIIDFLWLFVGYPLILGCGYWIGDKLYHLVFA